jgi:hypothetical protein
MLRVQQKNQFWQHHGISLDVCHTVTSTELAIFLQKKSNSLRKGAGWSNALKWDLAEMVLWSVCGWSCFSVFLLFNFVSCGGEITAGSLPTGPPT